MTRERTAAVAYLREVGEPDLADALERGAHRPRPQPSRGMGTTAHYVCGHPRTAENTVRYVPTGHQCQEQSQMHIIGIIFVAAIVLYVMGCSTERSGR